MLRDQQRLARLTARAALTTALRFAACAIAAAAVEAQTAAPPAQTASAQVPTFRAGTILVPVDVRAFDGKGRPITDLRREDFTIFEDDVRQDVALFAATALSPSVPDLSFDRRRTTGRADPENAPAFTVVRGNAAAPNPFRGAAISWTPPFTSSAPVSTPASQSGAWMSTPATDGSRDSPPMAVRATATPAPRISAMGAQSLSMVGASATFSDLDLEKLNAAIDRLRHEDGEKHLVFVASTPPTFDRTEDVDALIRAATDARVVIDVAQQGACGCWGVADLERIAHETGGVAAIYTSPTHAHDLIAAANEFEYQLGYYPSKTTLDERYRRIRVAVNRPGVTLAYRTGYYARAPALVMPPDVKRRYDRVSAALRSSIPALGLQVTATARGEKHGPTHDVVVHIVVAPDGLELEPVGDLRLASIDVVVLAANLSGALVGRSWNTADLNLSSEAYQRLLVAGMTLDQTVTVTAPAASVKVVVYDPVSDRVGSVMVDVK